MLDPDFLEHIPDAMVDLYAQEEADILADMARRINTFDYWIPASEWQAKKLEAMGMVREDIVRRLSQITGQSEQQMKEIMKQAGTAALESDDGVYRRARLDPLPLKADAALLQVLEAGWRKTNREFTNLTGTTANTASKQFEDALDRAHMQIVSGAFDQDTAVRMTIKDLARDGIGAVRYPSGHIDTIEVAVFRATRTGVNQTCLKLQEARMDEMGCDIVETSAHAGARPAHAVWQGQWFSRSGNSSEYPPLSDTGYGTGAGLGGWNCRHSMYPVIPGVSKPGYSKEDLAAMEEQKYTYKGHKMTEYEATQQQRYIERQIRRWKREEQAMKAAGLSTEEAAAKVAYWQNTQRDFIRQTGLKRQYGREQVVRASKGSGLSSGRSITSTSHRPRFSGKIDVTNKRLVKSKLKEFEESVVREPVEHAIVILQNGKTYRFVGEADRVNPEILGRILEGSVISHNHPAEETMFSFSMDDFNLFQKYQLAELHGFDEKYEYVLRRTGELPEIKELGLYEMGETDYWHQQIYSRAKKEGVYYERIERAAGGRRD